MNIRRPKRKEYSLKSLSLIGIPSRFATMDLEDFEAETPGMIQVRIEIANCLNNIRDGEFDYGLFLYGSNGVGKTMLSCIVAKEAYLFRWFVRRVTFVDYVNAYTRMWGVKSVDERDHIEGEFYSNYKGVELLVLDEVGKEIDSKVSAPILEDLLRYREDHGLITIICTNLTIDAFEKRYGQSCVSLVKGNMIPLKISAEDLRERFFKERV